MPEEYSQKTQGSGPTEKITDKTQTTGTVAASKIPGLHTLKGDISSYIKEGGLSLAEIVSQTQKQHRLKQATLKTGRIFFIIILLIFIAGAAAGIYYLFFWKEAPRETANGNSPQPLIPSDKKEIIRLKSEKPEEMISLMQKTTEALIPLNTMLNVSFFLETPEQTGFVGSQKFLEILKIAPPANFLQSLEKDFTFGVYYFKKNNPFLIFKVRSFDLAFSGILDWENNMADDLKDILLVSAPTNQKFQDAIIHNIDSRILYDGENNPTLIYAFFNRQYLIIGANADAFNELIRRLSIPRQ